MQTVKFVYQGSATRKLTVMGRDQVVIQGDDSSTQFVFTFPNQYSEYQKFIEWGDFYLINSEGENVRPIYPLTDDSFYIPYEITNINQGKEIYFNIIFYKNTDEPSESIIEELEEYVIGTVDQTEQIEVSLPYSVYVSKSVNRRGNIQYSDILTQIQQKAYVASEYQYDAESHKPNIKFSSLGGQEDLLQMDVTDIRMAIGVWDQSLTYSQNSTVVYDGDIYISLVDDNIGNEPIVGAYWKKTSSEDLSTLYTSITGDGIANSWVIEHSFGEVPVSVQVTYDSDNSTVATDVVVGTNTVTISTAYPLAQDEVLNIALCGKPPSNKIQTTITGDGIKTSWTIPHQFSTPPTNVMITDTTGFVLDVGYTVTASQVTINTSLPLSNGETLKVIIQM